MIVSPYPAFTLTPTGYASMPLTAAEQTLANMAGVMGQGRQKRNADVEPAESRATQCSASRWPEVHDLDFLDGVISPKNKLHGSQ